MYCTNCGAANNDVSKFCLKCGESFGGIQGQEAPTAPKIQKENSFPNSAGFFKALWDFSFTEFVTPKIIKFIYGLTILFAGLFALVLIIAGFSAHAGIGLFTLLIAAPVIFVTSVIYGRVFMEIIIVVFRIADHAAVIAINTTTGRQNVS